MGALNKPPDLSGDMSTGEWSSEAMAARKARSAAPVDLSLFPDEAERTAASRRVLIDTRNVWTWPLGVLLPFLYLAVVHALFWTWVMLEVLYRWPV